jgi:hypothetical protein
MKKIFTLFFALAIVAPAISSTAPSPSPVRASDIMIPIAKGKLISFQDLAYLKVSDYETITGKKLNFGKRMQFKLAQRKLRQSINNDGTLSNKRMQKMFDDQMSGTTGFHLGGFALGFFLFVIGVLIAYLIDDEKKANRVKWSWIGAAVALIFGFIFIF